MKTRYLQLRATREFLVKIDDWRDRQKLPVTRTGAIEYLINVGLEADEKLEQSK